MGGGSVTATHRGHVYSIQELREFGGGGSIEIIDIRAGRHVIEGGFVGTTIVVTDS